MPFDTVGVRDCYYVKSERDYWVKVARRPTGPTRTIGLRKFRQQQKTATALINLPVWDGIGTFLRQPRFLQRVNETSRSPTTLGIGGQAELYSTERLTTARTRFIQKWSRKILKN
jgi:hypothetical protein